MTAPEHHEQTRLFGFDVEPDGVSRAVDTAGPGEAVVGRFPELEADLCRRVASLNATDPLAPVTIVVGSHLVGRRLRERLVRELGAIAGVSVVTLARLVGERAAAGGSVVPVVVTQMVRERLLQRLVREPAVALRYLGEAARRPHFPRALAATVTDLRQACVDPQSDWARAVAAAGPAGDGGPPAVGHSGGWSEKAADLAGLYSGYCRELQRRGLVDDATLYAAAAAALDAETAAGVSAGDAALVFYGLYDLNTAQERFVAAALATGASVYVPLPRGAGEGGAPILSLASGLGLVVRRLDPPPIARDRERVSVIWQSARTAVTPSAVEGDGSLTVVSVSDERGEDREAARLLLEAADGGAAFHDCAVVVPHGDDVPRVAAALQSAGLPVACRLPDRDVGGRLLLLAADCLAPPVGRPFGRRAVVDLLAAAPSRVADCRSCESALWHDEARRAGVTAGAQEWVERISRRRRDLERRVGRAAEAVAADEDDERPAVARLRLAAARSLESAVRGLCGAAGRLPETAGWAAWCAALGTVFDEVFAAGPAAAARDGLAQALALDVLDEQVDVVAVSEVLRDLAGQARVPVGSVGRDGVAVLTPLEMRGLSFHTVVFTGLAEGGFPLRGRPDPILGDVERRRVAELAGVRLPLAEARAAESLLLFAFACEAATERLVLIAPRADAAGGRPRLPSRVLLGLAGHSAGRPVGLDEYLSGEPLRAVWRRVAGTPGPPFGARPVWLDLRERDAAALLKLGSSGAAEGTAAYLAGVLGDEGAARRRLGSWRAARSPEAGAWDGLLGEAARRALAAHRPFDDEMHPTRLERYLSCPFVFYLRDVLGFEVPEEPDEELEMSALEFGTLAHEILQSTYERLIPLWEGAGSRPDVSTALSALDDSWEQSCAEAERRGVTGAPLAWHVRRRMLLEDLRLVVGGDPVFAAGGGRPKAVEWRFGEAVGRPVGLSLADGRRVRFTGRIDRVDETVAGSRVIDYKTGRGGTESDRLKKGLAVQLPVYRLAVRQSGGVDEGPVDCLYRLVTRRGGFRDIELKDDETTSGERLRRLVERAIGLVDAGLFPRSREGGCDYCELSYSCGVSAWTRGRKREDEALRGLVRLQRSGPDEEDCDDA